MGLFTTILSNRTYTLPAGATNVSIKNNGLEDATILGTETKSEQVSIATPIEADEALTMFFPRGSDDIVLTFLTTTIKIIASY